MALLLRVSELPRPGLDGDVAAEAAAERLVEVEGLLRIGRAEGNDLVLDDPERTLSKTHCVIRREADGYVVIDSSTNGVFLNDARQRLRTGEAATLRTGDRIALGRFQLAVVSVIVPGDADDETASHAGPLGPVPGGARHAAPEPPVRIGGRDPLDSLLGEADLPPGASFEALLADADAAWPPQPPARASAPDHVPGIEAGLHDVASGPDAIPDDWDPMALLRGDLPVPAAGGDPVVSPGHHPPLAPDPLPEPSGRDPVPVAPEWTEAQEPDRAAPTAPPPGTAGREELRACLDRLLASCGMDPARLGDAEALLAAERAGQLLGIATDGLLRILGSRGVVKQAFHVERTAISQGANNPMKFTATASEALRLMLLGDVPGFLPAEDAMRETVADIQSHQLSLVSAGLDAVDTVMARLDPDAIEAAMPRHAFDALPTLRKAHAWDAFRAAFAQVGTAPGAQGGGLFAEALGRAEAAVRQRGAGSGKGDPDGR